MQLIFCSLIFHVCFVMDVWNQAHINCMYVYVFVCTCAIYFYHHQEISNPREKNAS